MVSDLRSCTMLSTLPLFYIAQSVNSDDRRTRFQGLRVIMGKVRSSILIECLSVSSQLGKNAFLHTNYVPSSIYNEVAGRFLKEYNRNNRLAQALLTLIGFCRIYYVFKIKVCLPFNILFLKVQFAPKKVFLSLIFFETLLQSCKSNRALHLC